MDVINIDIGAAVLPSQESSNGRAERIPRRPLPVQTCPACGSTWFREVTFHQWPAASKGREADDLDAADDSGMPVRYAGTAAVGRGSWGKDTECGIGSIP